MKKLLGLALFCSCLLSGAEFNQEMQNFLEELKTQAKAQNPNFVDFSAKEGERIFVTQSVGREGKTLSCESCHQSDLRKEGLNVFTNKPLEPLSPNANPKRLSEVKEVKKWLKRNFKDVYAREGSPKEQGDVLLYILSK